MVCVNLIQRPKNKVVRKVIGHFDKCIYFKDLKGITFSFFNPDECPLEGVCKHYKLIN